MKTTDLHDWFARDALPLWLEHGLDRVRGGCVEALDPDTLEGTADYRRLRVVTRQTYVFAAARRLGLEGADEGLSHTLDFLLGPARHPDGGFANRFDLAGATIDSTRDLYDLAFAGFALAHAHDARPDAALLEEGRALAELVAGRMRHPSGGFREALPDRVPRRQNPHMHLFEAALAWCALDPGGLWYEIARESYALFRDRFYQPATACLPEYYDDALAPLTGIEGLATEPGHHFEWSWLLSRAVAQGVADEATEGAALLDSARARGIAPSGLPWGVVTPEGRVLEPVTRLWSATEWLKAEVAARGDAARPLAAIARHLDIPRTGLWHERWDEGAQSFIAGPVPATSLYHVVLALEVALEGDHPRPFGTPARAAP